MVNGYLATGDIAPMIIFGNGPAANPFNSARDALYGWSATPAFQIDGLLQQLGWSLAIVQNRINTRLAVPSYLEISVDIVDGNSSGGTAVYTLTAEQDLGASPLKLYSAIVESGDIASSGYGVYSGKTLVWEPRAWPAGSTGTEVSFTGPYPQTVIVEKSYTLDPTEHNFENLDVVSVVQLASGNHEVMNAHFMDLPDTGTGIDDFVAGTVNLALSSNPSAGNFTLSAVMPSGATGSITIYDTTGRIVEKFDADDVNSVAIEESGVYFIHLLTNTGEVATERFTVIR